MKEFMNKVTGKIRRKWLHIRMVIEDNSGLSVVEMILILVGICTHEYGMYMECIS